MKTLFLALFLTASPAVGATWESFVDKGVLAAQRPPLLAALHVERLNADAFSSVMGSARIPLAAVQALPAAGQIELVQAQVGRYAAGQLAQLPSEDLMKVMTPAQVKTAYENFSTLRRVLGALPEDKRDAVLATQSSLWREASRRTMKDLLKEPESWKDRSGAGDGVPADGGADDAAFMKEKAAMRAAGLLVKPPAGARPLPAKHEPPLGRYDANGVSPLVRVGGEEFARTGRGLEELRGATYPAELLDVKALHGKKVLDLAMGAGQFVADLRALGVDAVGVDPYLNPFQKAHPEAFQEGLADKIPHPDASFDVIYSNWGPFVYHHEMDAAYVSYLKEMARVLKPGGRIRISPFLAEDLEGILRELPELALNPALVYGRSEGTPFMQRDVEWKGKHWSGDPFIELIRR